MSQSESSGATPTAAPPTVDAAAFRDVIRHLASGVTIVTSSQQGQPVGLTATAVCSVSATPPMLLASLTTTSRTTLGIAETGKFAVHLLRHKGRKQAEQFAAPGERFSGMKYVLSSEEQIPVLSDVLAWFVCQVEQTVSAADHTIVIGRVLECELKDKSPDPLLYFDRTYRKLAPGAEPVAENLEPWGSAQDAGLPGFGWS